MEDLNPPQVNTSLDLSISSCQHHLSPTRETITGAAGDSIHSRGKERPTAKQEGVVGTEDFNRITSEHKKLTEMLVAMYENVHAMQNQLININNSNLETKPASRKRKFDCYNWSNAIQVDEKFANCDEDLYKRVNQNPKSKISRAFFPTDPSDMSLIVKDGYHWRKYGQKVTRDNPSPRAYFKCSFAPNCPVKKKVQRSVENPTILVATYEGVHNHRSPTQAMNGASSVLGTPNSPTIMPLKPSSFSSSPSGVLDSFQLFRVCRSSSASKRTPDPELSEVVSGAYLPQVLVQQMVSALTSDPNFTATLATAISGKILEDELRQDWGQEGNL